MSADPERFLAILEELRGTLRSGSVAESDPGLPDAAALVDEAFALACRLGLPVRREDLMPPRGGAERERWERELPALRVAARAGGMRRRGGESGAPPLSENERRVLDLIPFTPDGITGKQIERETGIPQASLTRHTIPVLKKWHGVKNRPGVGYYRDRPGAP
jgi:hypothetical protein